MKTRVASDEDGGRSCASSKTNFEWYLSQVVCDGASAVMLSGTARTFRFFALCCAFVLRPFRCLASVGLAGLQPVSRRQMVVGNGPAQPRSLFYRSSLSHAARHCAQPACTVNAVHPVRPLKRLQPAPPPSGVSAYGGQVPAGSWFPGQCSAYRTPSSTPVSGSAPIRRIPTAAGMRRDHQGPGFQRAR